MQQLRCPKLFIRDLLRCPMSDSNRECFSFGNPSFDFISVRIHGTVISIDELATDETCLIIDDSTAVIPVFLDPSALTSKQKQELSIDTQNAPHPYIGRFIELIGKPIQFEKSVLIQCSAFTFSDDPLIEYLKIIKTIQVYNTVYLSNGLVESEKERIMPSKSSSQVYHPFIPQNITPRFGRAAESQSLIAEDNMETDDEYDNVFGDIDEGEFMEKFETHLTQSQAITMKTIKSSIEDCLLNNNQGISAQSISAQTSFQLSDIQSKLQEMAAEFIVYTVNDKWFFL